MDRVQADAVGEAFDETFTQDVQRVGPCALLEDYVARVKADFLQRGGESGAIDRRQLREGWDRGQLGGSLSDRLAGAGRYGHIVRVRSAQAVQATARRR